MDKNTGHLAKVRASTDKDVNFRARTGADEAKKGAHLKRLEEEKLAAQFRMLMRNQVVMGVYVHKEELCVWWGGRGDGGGGGACVCMFRLRI